MSETLDRPAAVRDEPMIKETEAAPLCGISVQWLQADRIKRREVKRRGPPFYKIGSRVLYKRSDCITWRESHRVSTSTAKEPA